MNSTMRFAIMRLITGLLGGGPLMPARLFLEGVFGFGFGSGPLHRIAQPPDAGRRSCAQGASPGP